MDFRVVEVQSRDHKRNIQLDSGHDNRPCQRSAVFPRVRFNTEAQRASTSGTNGSDPLNSIAAVCLAGDVSTAGRTHNEVGKGGFTTTRSEDLMQIPYVNLDDHRKLTDAPWFDT